MAKKNYDIDSLFDKPAKIEKLNEEQPVAQIEQPAVEQPVQPQPEPEQKPVKPVKQVHKETREEGNKGAVKQYSYGKKCTFEIPEDLLEDFQTLAFIQKKKIRNLLIEVMQDAVDQNKEAIKLIKSVK